MVTYYIGADVHCNSTNLSVFCGCRNVGRYQVPTTISAIGGVLDEFSGRKYLTFEEGPMAGWLYRNLAAKTDKIVVCDPRRNKYIATDGDKDDLIDADKLAHLLRGGYLRPVHQNDNMQIVLLKQWVSIYYDRVRDAVRYINKIRGRCRMYGIKIPRKVLRDPFARAEWLTELKMPELAEQLCLLWSGYDTTREQSRLSRRKLCQLGRHHQIVRLWQELPGVGIIRATTLLAYLDTPWRFKKKNRLWKYCGIGLQRQASGTDKYGKPKAARLKMPWPVNGALKNVVLGGANSAVRHKDNAFKRYYERMVQDGVMPSNAWHSVARKMLTVMWGMWKTMRPYKECLC